MRGLIFDLDGTLVDTVYPHIVAWQRAFEAQGAVVNASLLHPLIGLTGELLIASVGRKLGHDFRKRDVDHLSRRHLAVFQKIAVTRPPLPGAVELLRELTHRGIRYGIATSGKPDEIGPSLAGLHLDRRAVVVDGRQAAKPKPAPDPILVCLRRLRLPAATCYLIGDSIWDLLAARRAGLHSLGVLTGGRSESELAHAGASRVFLRLTDLLGAIDELGLD